MATTEEIAQRRAIARRVEVQEEMQFKAQPKEPDPLQEASRQQEEMRASILRQTAARQSELAMNLQNEQMENEVRKVKVERLKMEREERELTQAPKQEQTPGGALIDTLLATLLDRADRAEASRMEMMQKMLDERSPVHQDTGTAEAAESRVTDLQARLLELGQAIEVIDRLRGNSGQPQPVAAPSSLQEAEVVAKMEEVRTRAEIARMELAARERRAEEEHQRRMRQLANEEHERELRIQAERQRNQQMGDVVERLAPQAIQALQQTVRNRGGAAPPPQAPPIRIECPNPECKTVFLVAADAQRVSCPNCEMVLQRGEDSGPSSNGTGRGWPAPE